MRKVIISVNLITLAILICSPVIVAKENAMGKEIDRIDYQAKNRDRSRNVVAGVEQKIHDLTEKSKEIVHNVKDTMEQKQYEHDMKAAKEAKAKAEQRANDLLVQSVESAQYAEESATRAKEIAALIEAEQKAIAEEEATIENMPYSKDVAVQKYEKYLLAAQRAKEKADHDAFYYQLKSKKAAQQAYEAALNANYLAKRIETEQKAHALNEKFKKTMHESDHTNTANQGFESGTR